MKQITKYTGMQSYENYPEAIESEKNRLKLRSVKIDATQVLKKLYNSQMAKSQAPLLPEFHSVKSAMYRSRSKKFRKLPQLSASSELLECGAKFFRENTLS